ncbi:SDR family NAD(P)-dependent oxidoreductase [Micromonospora sp. NPDC050187]|uniref:SDR family NAD(P)-dependent oxidoreductase n=1 Tax=Micromonospora sp. NPDC050187 TaxID=3364277 RepID=UPI0037B983A1
METAPANTDVRPARGHVLVTGGNRGLGLATATLLVDDGWSVLLGCRDDRRGAAAATALRRRGGRAGHVPLDVTSPASIAAAADLVADRTDGRLAGLVNNAGVFLDERDADLESVTAEAVHELLAVNAVGPLLVTRAMLPLLRAAAGAAVVNVSADDADPATADGEATGYRMSKAALNIMTVNLAVALREQDVVVNAVDPGWIPTDMGGPEAPDDTMAAARLVAWAVTAARTHGTTGQVLTVRQPPDALRADPVTVGAPPTVVPPHGQPQ